MSKIAEIKITGPDAKSGWYEAEIILETGGAPVWSSGATKEQAVAELLIGLLRDDGARGFPNAARLSVLANNTPMGGIKIIDRTGEMSDIERKAKKIAIVCEKFKEIAKEYDIVVLLPTKKF